MNSEQIDRAILANASKINLGCEDAIRHLLADADEKAAMAVFAEMKSPTTVLLVSIFLGGLGIDRFILGQQILGVLKLVTCGGCGIWTITDWFTAGDRTRSYNTKKMLSAKFSKTDAAASSAAPVPPVEKPADPEKAVSASL